MLYKCPSQECTAFPGSLSLCVCGGGRGDRENFHNATLGIFTVLLGNFSIAFHRISKPLNSHQTFPLGGGQKAANGILTPLLKQLCGLRWSQVPWGGSLLSSRKDHYSLCYSLSYAVLLKRFRCFKTAESKWWVALLLVILLLFHVDKGVLPSEPLFYFLYVKESH